VSFSTSKGLTRATPRLKKGKVGVAERDVPFRKLGGRRSLRVGGKKSILLLKKRPAASALTRKGTT